MNMLKKRFIIALTGLPAILIGGIAIADQALRATPAIMTLQSVDWQGPERGFRKDDGPHHAKHGKLCDTDGWRSSLTGEQRETIDRSKRELHKATVNIFATLQVAEAELNQLSTASGANQSAINAKIDDISLLQNQLMKRKALHRQEVRKVLNEEQRLSYDAQRHGFHHGMSHRGNFGSHGERRDKVHREQRSDTDHWQMNQRI